MAAAAKIFTFVTVAALAVGFATADQDARTHAVGQPSVGLDMAIDDNNDGISDNNGSAIGIVQLCLQARPGELIAIDSLVRGIPAGTDFGGFSYVMELASTLSLAGSVYDDPAVNLLASAPGSQVAVTVTTGPSTLTVVASDPTAPEVGPASGVLGRYSLLIADATAGGVYDVSLGQVALLDSHGAEIQQAAGESLSGRIAVDPFTCAAMTSPTPTTTPEIMPDETPTVTQAFDSPSPSSGPGPENQVEPEIALQPAGHQPTVDDPKGRFLYPPLGFTTTINALFDHTNPRGHDGEVQIYTGKGGTEKAPCDDRLPAYRDAATGTCLYYDGHAGYDYELAGDNTSINAAADGCAVDVSWAEGVGLRIVLEHHNGYRTLYAHLDDTKPHIQEEQCVAAGDQIAFGGSTGCTCGRHLHFAVFDPKGRVTDPYGWWGEGPDPWPPTSRWLWRVEQPVRNPFAHLIDNSPRPALPSDRPQGGDSCERPHGERGGLAPKAVVYGPLFPDWAGVSRFGPEFAADDKERTSGPAMLAMAPSPLCEGNSSHPAPPALLT